MNFAIIGTQWGDEGKGKIVDYLSEKFDYIVRYQGGNNAGHTVVLGDQKFPLHHIPTGILHKNKICCIGCGVILNPKVFLEELQSLDKRVGNNTARLIIDPKAHLIMPWHILRDSLTGGKIGTTGRGIGPCYEDAIGRRGIRIGDFVYNRNIKKQIQSTIGYYADLAKKLNAQTIYKDYSTTIKAILKRPRVSLGDVGVLLDEKQKNRNILFEGAQATLLDIYFGTYPFVTSSHPTLGGIYIGTGFAPQNIKTVGVVKAYTTRVGEGPFPTELHDKVGKHLAEKGHEFGTTTGRPRRCGWLDLTIIRYAKRISGLSGIALTKLDILTGLTTLKVAVGYKLKGKVIKDFPVFVYDLERVQSIYHEMEGWNDDITGIKSFNNLPKQAKNYVKFIEKETGLPVKYIGVGPERSQLIIR
ncbi:adenylosuccinate synthase [Candidatus Roizmanbacteria bacterium RIFCSPLOWO2_02_FULL_37_19]|uniref:Adenylosuccinate synthetase n=1 Tax=Candidatus Roizmanbacteria bacterium RIFCSPHIGHO2_02_FULL_37_24 TaxID=1802037 RepID=A0A1F7H1R7_9BACT|nr:MAG: adenylosuccinate synthase [Candidatus Roizmanbacteria bacterium RIFCSPHIGHO2_01_FULL_38_41]OGK24816.1 MAG: adenylosuccinate synthase [Candidatus Roizmanbacteria bacterium RIFCSPHIGHO2_02_FULL_37_24]OGK32786.1 MAG: adenylosuccinate synthase [Candidatus Roizmanbacteria bacterium RIFCSPHIGHO2_12_FULL_37_23]OGK45588.1 MAG: adenylosuccinate synthase [Candidatus Roizmanbacteria bacterium RIFCSPLOWO2_01_FULL_37_57]OGK53632.1 MAG: adenylosuccinate synthase [Candidatus Roizmanbacteria bacterium 